MMRPMLFLKKPLSDSNANKARKRVETNQEVGRNLAVTNNIFHSIFQYEKP